MEIIAITLKNKFAGVNCYLLKSGGNCILVDTGWATKRADLEKELDRAGCTGKNLRLVILTHGDFDHCGNCAYLRNQVKVKIAMHHDDCGMVENSDLFWNRKKPNFIVKRIALMIFKLAEQDRFRPDIYLTEDDTLLQYGFPCRIVHIPGHSKGSIGILTQDGAFICGDLFENRKKPALNSLMDDPNAARVSVEKLQKFKIDLVYPGHGQPFPFAALSQTNDGKHDNSSTVSNKSPR